MRKALSLFLIVFVLLALCACGGTNLNESAKVKLHFVYKEDDIHVTLTEEEATKVVEILEGREYQSRFAGIPMCGFDSDISLQVGLVKYAVARDMCNNLEDFGRLKFCSVPEEDMAYIRSLFEKYGGYFPCN